jgi:arylformamidase
MAQAARVRTKGPLVWLDMDQQELDDAYDQAVYAPNRDQVHHRRQFNSARARAVLGEPLRFSYGPSQYEGLDVYRTRRTNAPVAVYIHGGAWRNGRSTEFAFLAELFVNAGAHSVILDFINIDEAGGNLMTMASQVRSAVAFVYKNAASFGGDPNRLYVCGHSSGGHLAGTVVAMRVDSFYMEARTAVRFYFGMSRCVIL